MKLTDQDALKWCVDGCAKCHHVQRPYNTVIAPGQVRGYYQCAKCGHRWLTNWERQSALQQAEGAIRERLHLI